jgi:GntR family transcriptional regulator
VAALDSAAPRVRYLEVAGELIAEIRGGSYELGRKLPTEAQLCSRFAVSRSTIRQALGELELAGLVERRQGFGTTLLARQPALRYVLSVTSSLDILRYAAATVLELDGPGRPVPMSDSRRLQLGDGLPWLVWRGIRRETPGGVAIGLTSVYLPEEYADVMETPARHPQRAVFEAISASYGLTLDRIDHAISATVLGEDEARLLRAAPGAPALVVTRRYISGSARLMEVSENIHPADRFSYELRLEREPAGRPLRARGS